MSPRLTSLFLALLSLIVARVSLADTTTVARKSRASRESAWARKPLALEARFGIATPIGAAGVGIDYSPLEFLGLECGVGTNFVGPEVGCGARLRLSMPSGTRALYLGASGSLGPHEQTEDTRYGALAVLHAPMSAMGHSSYSASYEVALAKWADVELGYESRSREALVLRVYAGVASLLNADDAIATDPPNEGDKVLPLMTALPYVGLALGKAF